MKKKILIISRGFYPGISPRAFRATELVKEFAREGHEVSLYTPKTQPAHFEFEREYGVVIKDLNLRWPPIKGVFKNRLTWLYTQVPKRLLRWLLQYPDIELMFKVKKGPEK